MATRFGIDYGNVLRTGEAVKDARVNRQVNEFKLSAAKAESEEKTAFKDYLAQLDASGQPLDMKRLAVQFPGQVMPLLEAWGKADANQQSSMRQQSHMTAAMLDQVLNAPQEQRAGQYEQMYQQLPPSVKEKVPPQYDEVSLRAARKMLLAMSGESGSMLTHENKMLEGEQTQKYALELQQQKAADLNALSKAEGKQATYPGGVPVGKVNMQTEASQIRSISNDLFKTQGLGFEDANGDWIGSDETNTHRLRIQTRAMQLRQSGQATSSMQAVEMAKDELGFPAPKPQAPAPGAPGAAPPMPPPGSKEAVNSFFDNYFKGQGQ